jgi:hypothetical protein
MRDVRAIVTRAWCGLRWAASRRQVIFTRRTSAADGEIVWSWRRDPGVYPARLCGLGNGDNKGRSPGRARINRKTIARGKPGCLGCTCQTRVRFFATIAHGAAGAVGARLSLRPLLTERDNEMAHPGENPPREYCRLFEKLYPQIQCRPGQAKRDPGPITTGSRFTKAGAPAWSNNNSLW